MWRIPQRILYHLVIQKPDTWFVLFLYFIVQLPYSAAILGSFFFVAASSEEAHLEEKACKRGKINRGGGAIRSASVSGSEEEN